MSISCDLFLLLMSIIILVIIIMIILCKFLFTLLFVFVPTTLSLCNDPPFSLSPLPLALSPSLSLSPSPRKTLPPSVRELISTLKKESPIGESGKVRRIPACAFFSSFFFFFLNGDQLVHINSILYARIGPMWLGTGSVPSVPWRVACELVSLIGSHTMPWQDSQPTQTSLGQGCMRV